MSMSSRAACLAAVLALSLPAALAVACGNDRPAAPIEPSVWVADDREYDGTRQYVTCEDQHDNEISVWVTDTQAKAHRKGAPCPDGELRSVDDDDTGLRVGSKFTTKPTVSTRSTSRRTSPGSTTTTTTTKKPTTTTTTTTTTKKTTTTTTKKTGQ